MRARRDLGCDICDHSRRRWQRLCESCWRNLPGDIRTDITDSYRRGDKPSWRNAKRRAIDFLATRVARHMESYRDRTMAMLGERDQ